MVRMRILASLVFLVGCSACENRVVSDAASPNGEKRVVVFSRECGATTGFNQQVAIVSGKSKLPDDGGNVFICDGEHGAVKDFSLSIAWKSPTELQISYPARARIFKKELDVDGVHIAYAPQ